MQRKQTDQLNNWNNQDRNVPLLVIGQKSVGKTCLVYDYAKSNFDNVIYLNFETDLSSHVFFKKDYSFEQIVENILFAFNYVATLKTVIILDEISFNVNALNLLYEDNLRSISAKIICISSYNVASTYNYMEVKVDPMDFSEFLKATGNGWYVDVIGEHYKSGLSIPDIVHNELLSLFNTYIIVGGMPKAINEYLSNNSIINISEQHSTIEKSYYLDFDINPEDKTILKSTDVLDESNHEGTKIKQIYKSIDSNLDKSNRAFKYSQIKKGATKKKYENALNYLINNNLAIKCTRIDTDHSNNSIPFKLYLSDVGLLHSRFKKKTSSLNKEDILKSLYENYIAQTLVEKGYLFSYWQSNSKAHIEFIIKKNNTIIPIEVRSNKRTRSRNLSVFKNEYSFDYAVKVSTNNFKNTDNIKYIPIYSVFCI